MKLSEYTLSSIREFITGDNDLTPYLTGRDLVKIFNDVGIRDIYDSGMPNNESRNDYAFTKLKEINGTKSLSKILLKIFDPRHFSSDNDKEINIAIENINPLIQQDGYKIQEIDSVFSINGADIPDEIEVEIHFEDIENEIITQIKDAKFCIWVAVAWFTNKNLMQELYNKKKEGLNIRLIIIDDEINAKYGFKYENVFETLRVKPTGTIENIMHHKFCVIDLKTVIHGSYNWTNKARWNNETITIDYGKEIADKFAKEFISLLK